MRYLLTLLLLCLSPIALGAETNRYPLSDNAASTNVDDPVGADDGVLQGGDNTSVKQTSSGPGGTIAWAFDLNGSDDYIDITGAAIDNAGAISISFWVNPDSVTNNRVMGRAASPFRYIELTSSTTITVATSGADSVFTVTAMSTGTWYHVLVALDGSDNMRLYLNGVESSTGAQTDAGAVTVDALGRSGAAYFNGRLSHVRFYDTNEAANVATLYAEGVTSDTALPIFQQHYLSIIRPLRGYRCDTFCYSLAP